jgi:acyl dehydratase
MSSPAVFDSLEKLLAAAPLELGSSAWVEVTERERADFAAATGGPPSPYLAVALTNRFLPDLMQVPAAASGVNYGTDAVTLGPVLQAGDRFRVSARLVAAVEVKGGVQTTVELTVETDGSTEPACTVMSLSRWLA